MPIVIAMVSIALVTMLIIQLKSELVQNDMKPRLKRKQSSLKKRTASLKNLKGQLKKKKKPAKKKAKKTKAKKRKR